MKEDFRNMLGADMEGQFQFRRIIARRFGERTAPGNNVLHRWFMCPSNDKMPTLHTMPRILYAWLQLKCKVSPDGDPEYVKISTPFSQVYQVCKDNEDMINEFIEGLAEECEIVE
jgi:hypothetical protein